MRIIIETYFRKSPELIIESMCVVVAGRCGLTFSYFSRLNRIFMLGQNARKRRRAIQLGQWYTPCASLTIVICRRVTFYFTMAPIGWYAVWTKNKII